jgi:hypothetical protein
MIKVSLNIPHQIITVTGEGVKTLQQGTRPLEPIQVGLASNVLEMESKKINVSPLRLCQYPSLIYIINGDGGQNNLVTDYRSKYNPTDRHVYAGWNKNLIPYITKSTYSA